MEHAEPRKFNIIVFGASGFTGQFVVEEIAMTMDSEAKFTWAVAGRDMKKLQAVLSTASKLTEKDLSMLPIITADVDVESSLIEMCNQAEILLNCVGPYSFYGTSVVKACIEAGTHHIDISGEPGWLEKTQVVYDAKAQEAGVYVLEACGFDSIPAEMGLLHARKQFDGDVNGVENFVSVQRGPEGGGANYGTWLSAVNSFANRGELKVIRRELCKTPMPRSPHRLPRRSALFHNSYLNKWCVPFPGADRSIVYQSEYFKWQHQKQRPAQFEAYYACSGLMEVFFLMLVGVMFALLTKFSLGVSLLKTYPRLFSLGSFSKTGPTRKQIAESTFTMTLIGRGYVSRAEDSEKPHDDDDDSLPTQTLITRVTGPDPGYITTAICMVQAAYVLMAERDKLPHSGGVLTPGAAFAETSLLERLQCRGLQFAVVEKC